MRYGVIPENILERAALWAGKVPLPMMDAIFGIVKTRTLMVAVKLGVFECLKDESLSADQVATRLSLDADTTLMLLRSLVYGDYLEQSGANFALSPLSRRSMIAGAPEALVGFFEWNFTQWHMVEHLEELLRTGRGLDFHGEMTDPAQWAAYQRAMLEVARFDAATIAKHLPIPNDARRLLDLAGSHGLLSAMLCRAHPPLHAEIFDLPQALPHARALAEEAGHLEHLTFRSGDLLADPSYGELFDVVLLANILHHFKAEQNQTIIERAVAALAPTGIIAIWDFETPRPDQKAGMGDGIALFFRLTSSARCYHGDDYQVWLRAAGCDKVQLIRPLLSPGNVLVVGYKS